MNAKMNKELDDVLKECLMQDLQVVGEKVYKKIAGLPNLGRTYFCKQSEVNDKKQFAQDQMVNKYGAEMYGLDAQLGNQSSTGTAASTGNSGSSNASSLISCKCTQFLKIPDKQVKESSNGGGYQQFQQPWDNFQKWVNKKNQDEKWKSDHESSWQSIVDWYKKINGRQPADDSVNKNSWNKIEKILKSSPWNKERKNDKDLDKLISNLKNGYTSWDANDGDVQGDGNSPSMVGQGDNSWDSNLTFKIDVHTIFDDKWFLRKFKSGMLNKILFTIKTDMRSHSQGGTKGDWTGHNYTADEMLPQDKRKLDSLQWKMTNKVAKDYIALLLGWSRPREKYHDEQGMTPVHELSQDTGFGKSMAKKALDNRGILGRLKQKIFSGQQSNNLISVVFQLDDPNDYTVIERKEDKNNEVDISTNDEQTKETPQEQRKEQVNESSVCSFGFTMKLDDDAMMKLLEESVMEDFDVASEICEGNKVNQECVNKLVDDCLLKMI